MERVVKRREGEGGVNSMEGLWKGSQDQKKKRKKGRGVRR